MAYIICENGEGLLSYPEAGLLIMLFDIHPGFFACGPSWEHTCKKRAEELIRAIFVEISYDKRTETADRRTRTTNTFFTSPGLRS